MQPITKFQSGVFIAQPESFTQHARIPADSARQMRKGRPLSVMQVNTAQSIHLESASASLPLKALHVASTDRKTIRILQEQFQASAHRPLSVEAAKHLTCQIQDATNLDALHDIVITRKADLNSFHLSALACSCARMLHSHTPSHRSNSPPLPPRDLRPHGKADSNTQKCVRNHNISITTAAHAIFARLLTLTHQRLSSLDARCIANILWATAKSQYPIDRELLGRFMHEILLRGPSFRPQELANIAWALATISRIQSDVLNKSASLSQPQLIASHSSLGSGSRNAGLTSTTDVAVLHSSSPSATSAADSHDFATATTSSHYLQTLPSEPAGPYDTQNPSSCLTFQTPFSSPWITPSQSWLHGFMLHATPQVPSMNIQEQTSLLWSLATMHYSPHPQTLPLLESATLPHLHQAHPQELTNLLWSFSQLSHIPSTSWQDAYFRAALRSLPWYNAQDLAITLYSCAKLQLLPPAQFMRRYIEAANAAIHTFSPQALSNMIWAAVHLQQINHRSTASVKRSHHPEESTPEKMNESATQRDLASLKHVNGTHDASIRNSSERNAIAGRTAAARHASVFAQESVDTRNVHLKNNIDSCNNKQNKVHEQNVNRTSVPMHTGLQGRHRSAPHSRVHSSSNNSASAAAPSTTQTPIPSSGALLDVTSSSSTFPGPYDTSWVVNVLHTAVLPILPHFPPHSLSTLFCAISKLPTTLPQHTSQTLLSSAIPLLPRFTPSQYSHLLHALVSLPHPLPPSLHAQIATTTHSLLPTLTSAQIPIILWSLTRLHVSLPPATLDLYISTILAALPEMTPHDLTLLLWSLPAYKVPQSFLTAVAQEAEYQLPSFHPKHLAIIWARLQQLGFEPSASFSSGFFSECTAKAPQMSPRDAAAVMWASAKMRRKVPRSCMERLWERTAGAAAAAETPETESSRSGEGSVAHRVLHEQSTSSKLQRNGFQVVSPHESRADGGQRGYAGKGARVLNGEGFNTVAGAGEFNWEDEMWEASLGVWKGWDGRVGEEEDTHLGVTPSYLSGKLEQGQSQELSTGGGIVTQEKGTRAFGGERAMPLSRSRSRSVIKGGLKGSDLVAAVWAAGVLLLVPPSSWLDTMLPMFQDQLDSYSTRDISSVMWALARLHVYPGAEWLEDVLQACSTSMDTASALHLTNIAWAMSRFGEVPTTKWMKSFFNRVASVEASFTPVQKRTLHQSLVKMGLDPEQLMCKDTVHSRQLSTV